HQGAGLMRSRSCDMDVASIKPIECIGTAQEILETIGDGFCAIDSEWQIVYVNQRACEMWGLTPGSLIGRGFWKVFPEITGTDGDERPLGAIKAGSRVEYEAFSPILGRWLWVRVCPMSSGLFGLYWRDISDRKCTETALRESEERFRQVFEQSPLGMATADLDGRFREVNLSLCRMLGYAAEDMTRVSYLDIVYPDDREECARQGLATAAGEILHVQLEERLLRRSGDPVWVRINISPVRGQDNRILYTLGIIES